jgi:D-glycero-D-manno-heptose 1,7-bisphosphate phosphatase
MRALKKAGFALVVVTNQPGIARGYYTEDQYQALTIAMKQALVEASVAVDTVYHCPRRRVSWQV